MSNSFIEVLKQIPVHMIDDASFMQELYCSMCNVTWNHKTLGEEYSCSWRHAGGVVAGLIGEGDYLDWYCSGCEGIVSERVAKYMKSYGWEFNANTI